MASSLFVSLTISLLPILLFQAATGEAPAPAELPRSELAAIFRVMGDLLGDTTWAELHPRPCTDTPWPGLQCELAPDDSRRLRATRLHFGPDVSAPPCRPGARLAAPAILGLPHLRTLSLFGCFVGRPVELPPALFTNASSLEQLVLKSNPGLTGRIPATLSNLRTSLQVLSLSQNGFRGEIPRELGGLAALQQLDLSYNNLTGQIPEEIGGMTRLTILDLSWNGIEGGVPGALGSMRMLQKADLSYNRFVGQVPPEIGSLKELVFLDLSHNGLAGPLPATLSGLSKLQYLLLQDNPIGTAVPAVVGSLRGLQVLGLSGCNLTGPIGPFFAALGGLMALSLDRNRLDGPIPASLGALPHLGQLNLSQNRLAGEIALPREFVARLGRRLDVRGNDELCVGRGLRASFLGAPPPCVAGGGGPGNVNGTSSALEDEGSGCRGYGVVGGLGGLLCHLVVLLMLVLDL